MIELKASAYQGKGWRPRVHPHSHDLNGRLWSHFRVNSEWARLKAVLLYSPSNAEIRKIREPHQVQHLRRLSHQKLKAEYSKIKKTYRALGIEVHEIQLDDGRLAPPNLMFVRDLFFGTPEGAVISRMASQVRAGEEKYALISLAKLNIPILTTMRGDSLFEGADALWLNPKTVLCGVGARTNLSALVHLRALLKEQDVQTMPIRMPAGVQHLLGILQIVDRHMAVVRIEKAPRKLLRALRANCFDIVPVKESEEVVFRLGMNFVTVAPKKVVMAADCPHLRSQLEKAGVEVLAQLPIGQLTNAAGGLGCATGILAREEVK